MISDKPPILKVLIWSDFEWACCVVCCLLESIGGVVQNFRKAKVVHLEEFDHRVLAADANLTVSFGDASLDSCLI